MWRAGCRVILRVQCMAMRVQCGNEVSVGGDASVCDDESE